MSDRLNRLRIGLITGADLRRAAPGGTRTYVLGLASFLVQHGLAVEIFSNGPVEGAPARCQVTRIMIEHVPSSRRFQRGIARWAYRERFRNVGLLHFQRPDDLWPIRRLEALPPAICTLHGDPSKGIRRRHGVGLALAYRLVELATITRFAAIISVDDKTAETYRSRYPSMMTRIHVIPNAADDEFLKPVSAPSNGHVRRAEMPSSSPTFVFVGRLSKEKRVDAIIRGVLSGGAPKGATLLIAGSGPEEEHLRHIANGSKIRFLGNVDHRSMAHLYDSAAALILASEYEGIPTVALEAIASGCPVIAPAGCGLDRLLESGRGFLIADLSELPNAMSQVAKARWNSTPLSLPRSFHWSSVGERLVEVYRTVAPGIAP